MKKISSRSIDNSPESKKILQTATKLFNGSKKVYIQGSTNNINVPVRKVLQTSSITSEGKQTNPPIYLYDTSGPYSDPDISIDIEKGLPKNRDKWLKNRKKDKPNSTQMSLAREGIITCLLYTSPSPRDDL